MSRKSTFVIGLSFMMLSSIASAAEHTVTQKDKSFQVGGGKVERLSIMVGDTVNFPNEDAFFHNIFSLSDLKMFDLGSYTTGEAKSVTFDEPGEVEIECAIHPEMFMVIEIKI